ncbi:MAG: radical SAM protein [Clostridia bacterium]|nr:radical SAM protein [Clostridia bacterium]
MKSAVIPVFIPHLGCPNDCIFCNQRRIAAPKVPDVSDVRGIIESALEYTKLPQISFYGGSFTCIDESLQERYLSAAYEYVRAGRADSLRVSTRPDGIDGNVLARLKKYGVKTIELGAQSMDDRVLLLARRGHTAEDVRTASKMIKQAGFELVLQIMPGLPGADARADMQTAREIAALKPDAVRIYPVCVIKDTALCDMYERGEYIALTPETAAELCADIWEIFIEEQIPVIRIGLNPTEELSDGAAVAGAYHPAMGQLVRSERLYKKAVQKLDALLPFENALITVPRGKLSDMRGQKNANAAKLRERYPGSLIEIKERQDQKEEIFIAKI